MLYRIATNAVQDARQSLVKKEVASRGQAISKACAAIIELTSALDFDKGGEIAYRLRDLYTYIQRRLTTAHREQSEEALIEVIYLLSILYEAAGGTVESLDSSTPPRPPVAEAVYAGSSDLSAQSPSAQSRRYSRVLAAFSAV